MKTNIITKEVKDQIVQKIRGWWEVNGGSGPAVIGISGGKDSSVVAALCVAALGRDKVLGVLMPNGKQKDISDSQKLCKHLKITSVTINIAEITSKFLQAIHDMNQGFTDNKNLNNVKWNAPFKLRADYTRYTTNIPPRVRMTLLYAVAQNFDGRVIGTGNAAESYIGWTTLFGDLAGDFNPIKNLFVDEVVDLGRMLGLPKELVEKKPADGLTDKTDEENLGFTYADVKKVALKVPEWQIKDAAFGTFTPFAAIECKHKATAFKGEIVNVPGIDFYRDKYGYITSVK